MRLLVTGGAGSLGSNIIENVGDECEEIIVIDNFATGKKESLPPRSNVQIVEGSVVDSELVNKVFSTFRPTHVIHSAAA
jgi:UDP-glucose 4-epimerase